MLQVTESSKYGGLITPSFLHMYIFAGLLGKVKDWLDGVLGWVFAQLFIELKLLFA